MKIAVINGSMRHGSTWHCMDLFRRELAGYDNIECAEFFLPKDMPHFCAGCFSCFYNGEDTCPHASDMNPVTRAITGADLIILTSPVYAMDVSGQIKALLDHLCFMWMSHRPDPRMFRKIGVIISTTAGAGLGHAAKTLKNSLVFWGVKKVFSYKNPVSASSWKEVSAEKKAKIEKDMAALAKRAAMAVKNRDKLPNPLFRTFFFRMMAGMMKKNTWNPRDRHHWETHGWLDGKKAF